MILKRIALFFLAFAWLALPARAASSSVVLMEAHSGRVLVAQNAHERKLIASTTKIMTCLIVLERCSEDHVVTIDKKAVGVEGSSLYLKEGDKLTCGQLLSGLMLASGNDAAVALAIHCAGSVELFADWMNERAAQLGMKNSHFANPHGLNSPEHYSTAYDMALLTAHAMLNERFVAVVSQKTATVGSATLRNHNKLLWSVEGCNGVKTGYTKDAGRCLVSGAERDGRQLIVVTLNTADDWRIHTALLESAFAKYTNQLTWKTGEPVAEIPVFAGTESSVGVVVGGDLSVLLTAREAERCVVDVRLPRYTWAPVASGEQLGELTVSLDGKVMGRTALLAGSSVAEQKTTKKWFFF